MHAAGYAPDEDSWSIWDEAVAPGRYKTDVRCRAASASLVARPPGLRLSLSLEADDRLAVPGGRQLGLDADVADRVSIVVVKVNHGPVWRWNEANPQRRLEPGDRIVEVNGCSGDGVGMALRLQQDAMWSMVVQRPAEVSLSGSWKSYGMEQKHGLALSYTEGSDTLLILSVKEGFVKRWNALHPDTPIQPNDRIVEVSGQRGEAGRLAALLNQSSRLDVVIRRYR